MSSRLHPIRSSFSAFGAWVKATVRRFMAWSDLHPILSLIIISFLLNLLLEILSRRSFDAAFHHLIFSFPVFFYNFMVVLALESISLIIPKHRFVRAFVSGLLLALAITDFAMQSLRITPFSFTDITLLSSVFPIIGKYLNPVEIILIVIALVAIIGLIVFGIIKSKSSKIDWKRGGSFCLITVLLTIGLTFGWLKLGILSGTFNNLVDAYHDYGFMYCFGCSIFDRGISKPSRYSDDMVIQIKSKNESKEMLIDRHPKDSGASDSKNAPNVIFVQLESFFDVDRVKGLTFSEDPLPNFHYLQDTCPHGHLKVPSIGAGTANTEFEVLSGMNLAYFGAGEYPYKTILQGHTCESIAYNLKAEGYATHALHNNNASFYDRNTVFANLGFDTFTSVEYMQNVRLNPMGWARDAVLNDEIDKILDATTGQDFIYAITVQSHGKYLPDLKDTDQHITVDGLSDEDEKSSFEYYIGQLHQVDQFVGNLVNQLQNRDEKTILVMYGDHLPSFDFQNEDLTDGDRLETDYVIWSNFPINDENRDIYAYQLSAYIMAQLGYSDGVLTKFHQSSINDSDYQQQLELLQYDMLYGDNAALNGKDLKPTDLHMGTEDIKLTGLEYLNNQLYVTGSGFTPYSVVNINDDDAKTVFVDSTTLIALVDEPEAKSVVTVSQVGNDRGVLSTTMPRIYNPAGQ